MRRRHRMFVAVTSFAIAISGAGLAAQDKAAIEQGVKVYTAQKCSLCHSIAGKGAKNGPLDEAGSKLTADEIRQWIVNAPEMTKKTNASRKPPMKNYASHPKEDVDALVAYVSSLKKS